jgi:hypothetical protein
MGLITTLSWNEWLTVGAALIVLVGLASWWVVR